MPKIINLPLTDKAIAELKAGDKCPAKRRDLRGA